MGINTLAFRLPQPEPIAFPNCFDNVLAPAQSAQRSYESGREISMQCVLNR